MNVLDIWQQAQSPLRNRVGTSSYETWFAPLQAKEKSEHALIIETPDEFFKNWLLDHYFDTIESVLKDFYPDGIALEISVNASLPKTSSPSLPTVRPRAPGYDSSLNPRFSFDNFVVGPSNRFAYAACMAVAESPAKAYNPLFLYGKVGLGKTHLLQSITHHIKLLHADATICYLSSERFTNELIDAIRHRSTAQFRQKYRSIDVLLIDDIHFIAGKESTQEEFFHTFNALHNNRKQIIISSDRPPKDIANLEERLTSRFAWGLITDIQPPDYETRVAILRKKSEREPVQIPEEVITFIAEKIKTNIRELEGALIRVVAYSLLEEKPITLDIAKVVLKDLMQESMKTITVEMVQKHVSDFFNIPSSDLKAKRRNKNVVLPRQVAMYLTRHLTNSSLPEIGSAFGGKDHTTVLHSCKKIENNMLQDQGLKNIVEKLKLELKR